MVLITIIRVRTHLKTHLCTKAKRTHIWLLTPTTLYTIDTRMGNLLDRLTKGFTDVPKCQRAVEDSQGERGVGVVVTRDRETKIRGSTDTSPWSTTKATNLGLPPTGTRKKGPEQPVDV